MGQLQLAGHKLGTAHNVGQELATEKELSPTTAVRAVEVAAEEEVANTAVEVAAEPASCEG